MSKYVIVQTDEQIAKRKAFKKAVESLEYNPMCYNCRQFGNDCAGEKNKIYSGCIYKEDDFSKPSIYSQIIEKIK